MSIDNCGEWPAASPARVVYVERGQKITCVYASKETARTHMLRLLSNNIPAWYEDMLEDDTRPG